MTATQAFAELVTTHAIKAGYNLSGPRSGGKKALADDTGMSHSSICRMLNGQTIPAPEVFESLADAIDVHVGHLFELAGIVSPGALTAAEPPDPRPLTARQAAARLGITKPLAVEVFEAITATLLASETTP